MSETRRRLIITLICLGAFLAPATLSYALWSSSAMATITVVTASAVPASPGNYRCVNAPNKNQRNVAWNTVTGATGYRLFVLKDGGWTQFKSVSSPTVSVLLKDNEILNVSSPQQTLVRAFNSNGESGDSNTLTLHLGDTTACP
jgi:hypothetical protein